MQGSKLWFDDACEGPGLSEIHKSDNYIDKLYSRENKN